MENKDFCRVVNWYPVFGEHALLTGFLKLTAADVKLLADGIGDGEAVKELRFFLIEIFIKRILPEYVI